MGKSAVKVYIRGRPTASVADGFRVSQDSRAISINLKKKEESGLVNNQLENLNFKFERVLQTTSQEGVFTQCAQDVCDNVLGGYNGTVFAYGQTGAGKTYTIAGDINKYDQRGIIPRSVHYLFHEIDFREDREVKVSVSYLEIYNEVMYDLLADNPGTADNLVILEEGGVTQVKGITKKAVGNEEEALAFFFQGENGRSTAQHLLNKSSSRSHCVFTVYLETRAGAGEKVVNSKLNLVDLAGSERTKKTQVTGQTLKEAMFINKSLTFLEQTVNALSKHDPHVPFRQTKLTSVLRDALGGNCKTVMVGCIWGEEQHLEETVSTLRFASRVKTLVTDAVINEHNDPMLLMRKYERQIQELKQELAMRDTLSGAGRISYDDLGDLERHELHQTVRKFLKGEITLDDIRISNLKTIKETFKQFKVVYDALDSELADQKLQAPSGEGGAEGAEGEGGAEEGGEAAELVGDADKDAGTGFHIGQAPEGARPKEDEGEEGGEGVARAGVLETPPGLAGGQDKSAAFEGYKRDTPQGQELSQQLKVQMAELREKKKNMRESGLAVNEAKKNIDRVTAELKSARGDGADDGQVGPEEVRLLSELKVAKATYRDTFTAHKELKGSIDPLQAEVDVARQSLVNGFNEWFIGKTGEKTGVPAVEEGDEEELDAAEEFDNLEKQRILADDPESAAYHAARKTLNRKKQVKAAQFHGDKGRAEGVRKLEQRAGGSIKSSSGFP